MMIRFLQNLVLERFERDLNSCHCPFTIFPDEIMTEIIFYISSNDLMACQEVSKLWRHKIQNYHYLWIERFRQLSPNVTCNDLRQFVRCHLERTFTVNIPLINLSSLIPYADESMSWLSRINSVESFCISCIFEAADCETPRRCDLLECKYTTRRLRFFDLIFSVLDNIISGKNRMVSCLISGFKGLRSLTFEASFIYDTQLVAILQGIPTLGFVSILAILIFNNKNTFEIIEPFTTCLNLHSLFLHVSFSNESFYRRLVEEILFWTPNLRHLAVGKLDLSRTYRLRTAIGRKNLTCLSMYGTPVSVDCATLQALELETTGQIGNYGPVPLKEIKTLVIFKALAMHLDFLRISETLESLVCGVIDQFERLVMMSFPRLKRFVSVKSSISVSHVTVINENWPSLEEIGFPELCFTDAVAETIARASNIKIIYAEISHIGPEVRKELDRREIIVESTKKFYCVFEARNVCPICTVAAW
jgi:hypothetical protein